MTLPSHGRAIFSVAWAGESESENWFDVARDYTERWHHQQQIRDAVGRPGYAEPRFSGPGDCHVRARSPVRLSKRRWRPPGPRSPSRSTMSVGQSCEATRHGRSRPPSAAWPRSHSLEATPGVSGRKAYRLRMRGRARGRPGRALIAPAASFVAIMAWRAGLETRAVPLVRARRGESVPSHPRRETLEDIFVRKAL